MSSGTERDEMHRSGTEKMVEVEAGAIEAMRAVGAAVRGDWSEFDGRWLRNLIDDWAECVKTPPTDWDAWLRNRLICPECRSFDEHCDCEARPQ